MLASVTVREYNPVLEADALEMEGLASVEVKRLGPDHEYPYPPVPPETVDESVILSPSHTGVLLLVDALIAEGCVTT